MKVCNCCSIFLRLLSPRSPLCPLQTPPYEEPQTPAPVFPVRQFLCSPTPSRFIPKWRFGFCFSISPRDLRIFHVLKMIPESPENESRVQPSLAENPRMPMFRRCISSIVHAIHCHQENCTDDPTCHKMKGVIYHTRICRRRVQGSCPICKQFLALCFLHCKYCMGDDCIVPFCSAVKESVQRIQLPGSANDRPSNDFAIPL